MRKYSIDFKLDRPLENFIDINEELKKIDCLVFSEKVGIDYICMFLTDKNAGIILINFFNTLSKQELQIMKHEVLPKVWEGLCRLLQSTLAIPNCKLKTVRGFRY